MRMAVRGRLSPDRLRSFRFGCGPSECRQSSLEIADGATRERLATLYGDRARLELVQTAEGGARVTVRLPYRELEGAR